jgi:hypothetical protein
MGTPIETYFQEKKAAQLSLPGMGGMGGRIGGALGQAGSNAAIGAVASAGAAGLGVAASKIYDAITKRQNFLQMLEHNPDLEESLRDNPKLFNQAYSSLRVANPAFSRDPLIAGTYMRKIMDSPLGAGGFLGEAMDHQSHGRSPVMEAFGKGALEGAKAGLGSKR